MRPADHDLDRLADILESLASNRPRVLLGITGAPGSGKTTLAEALVRHYAGRHGPHRVAYLPMDGFHLADVQLTRLGLTDVKGAPDTFDAGGYAALLARIAIADEPVYAPGFERVLEQPIAQAIEIPPTADVVVTEGNYLLLRDGAWRGVAELLDEIWYVDVPDEIRQERLLARHIRFGKEPAAAKAWITRVDEPNAELIMRNRDRATRVIT